MDIKKLINSWWMSPDWWVQGAHFLLGAGFVMLPFWLTQKLTYSIVGTMALGIYGTVKEVVLDPWIEGNKFLWDGAVDMGFLFLGGAMAWLIKLVPAAGGF